MKQENVLRRIVPPLLQWYAENGRRLPWRETVTPYRTWVSEIMLQQTRVAAVIPYFERFMAALPTVYDLAAVPDGELLKLWEGLGYYSRARHLKQAAELIVRERGGTLPDDYEALRALPGIGDYTAGAILSIAFSKPVPAVDGNALRITARLTCLDENILSPAVRTQVREALARALPDNAGAFNQAVMDLGAAVCLPKKPLCEVCPLSALCGACQAGKTEEFPVRIKKTKRRTEQRTVFLLENGGGVALSRRPDEGLLAGLWELPGCEGFLSEREAADWLRARGITVLQWKRSLTARHLFTHIEWQMKGYELSVRGDGFSFATAEEFHRRAIPGAFSKFIPLAEAYFSAPGDKQ